MSIHYYLPAALHRQLRRRLRRRSSRVFAPLTSRLLLSDILVSAMTVCCVRGGGELVKGFDRRRPVRTTPIKTKITGTKCSYGAASHLLVFEYRAVLIIRFVTVSLPNSVPIGWISNPYRLLMGLVKPCVPARAVFAGEGRGRGSCPGARFTKDLRMIIRS